MCFAFVGQLLGAQSRSFCFPRFSCPAMVFSFLLVVFLGCQDVLGFFRGVEFLPVFVLQAMVFCVFNLYTDYVLSARSHSCYFLGFFVLSWCFIFVHGVFWAVKPCWVFFAVLLFGLCSCFRPWRFAFSILTKTRFRAHVHVLVFFVSFFVLPLCFLLF